MLKQIAKGATILSVGSILTKILSLIYVPILARSLGASGLGTFNLALALTPWFIVIGSLSMETVLTKVVAENKDNQEKLSPVIRVGILFSIFSGLFFSLLYFFTAPFFTAYLFHNPGLTVYFQLVAPFIFLTITYNSILGILRGLNEFKLLAAIDVLKQLIVVIFGSFFLLVLGWNVYGAISALLISLAPLVIFGAFHLRIHHLFSLKTGFSNQKGLFSFGVFQTIFDIVASAPPTLDDIFLGIFASTAVIGLYGAALTLATYATFFIIPIRKTLFPFVSEAFAKGDFPGMKRLTEETVKYALMIVCLSSLGFQVFSRELLLIFFGKSFLSALPLLQGLLLVVIVMSFVQVLNVSLVAANQVNAMTLIQLASILIAGGMGYFFLVPKFGAYGAGVMLGLVYTLNLLGYLYLSKKHLQFSILNSVKIIAIFSILFAFSTSIPDLIAFKIGAFVLFEAVFLGALLSLRIVTQSELKTLLELFFKPIRAIVK